MKRITRIIRPIICMAVLLFAMTTAVMGCYQKGPDTNCTRAQAVTFLWCAAGSPKPGTRTMAFHRRSRGQLLLRCCAVGGRKRHHQGHQRHRVQP